MGYKRAEWHSGLTYHQECYECKTPVDYNDYKLGFRPWFPDGFVYCPKCKTPLRHNEAYAVNAPVVAQPAPVVAQPAQQEVPVWEVPAAPKMAQPVQQEAPIWEVPAAPAPVVAEPVVAAPVVEIAPVWEEPAEIAMVEPVYEAPAVAASIAPEVTEVPEEEEIPMFCSRCGKKFRDDDIFCSGCGAKRIR